MRLFKVFLVSFLLNITFGLEAFAAFDGVVIPSQPALAAKAFILIDADSGRILAKKNAEKKFAPASLTKIMSMYIVSGALANKQIGLNDQVVISKHAWQQKGSRMFVKLGSRVSVGNLIKGTIVVSGNDSTMALAEYAAGSENGFVDMMNHAAQNMGLNHSHFVNPTGMPAENHYSSASDLGVIAKNLVVKFPSHYKWYSQKWFHFNKIKQPNRNRLLWRDPSVDGLKTGHTDAAGYCLVASAKRDNMRLIVVVLGASSDLERTTAAKQLFDYGFRFYKTSQLGGGAHIVSTIRTWQGDKSFTQVGLHEPLFVTYPHGMKEFLHIEKVLPKSIAAPVVVGQVLGQIKVYLQDKVLISRDLVALNAVDSGGRLKRMLDTVRSWVQG